MKFFPTSFAVILPAVALPVGIKAEFNFELILYITIFVFLSPGSFFKSVICFKSVNCTQNSLKSAPIVLFSPQLKGGKIIHLERFEGSAHLDLLFFLFILSAKEVICPF